MKVKVPPSMQSRLRIGLIAIIALMMVSSTAIVILFNPAQVLAYSRVIGDSYGYSNPPMSQVHSPSVPSSSQSTDRAPTPSAPSTISQEADFAQAPLQIPRTLQSTDLVNSLAFYEVTLITSTTGSIDKIRMDFPAGTNINAAGVIERVGIGGGALLKSGSSITFDVTTPVSIPAGTFIRLEIFGIKNTNNPSTIFTATITTRDSGGNLIDGPSQTNVYTIKKVGSSDLADGGVTSTKPAESFMKKVTIFDNDAGHVLGWDPNGIDRRIFFINEPLAGNPNSLGSNAIVNVVNGVCSAGQVFDGLLEVVCTTPPFDTARLNYTIINLPPNPEL